MDLSKFSYNPNKTAEERKEYRLAHKYQNLIAKQAKSFDVDFAAMEEGDQVRLITTHSVNAIVAIEKIQENYQLEEVFICVYRMNERAVTWIKDNLKDAGVKSTLLLSEFFRENKRYEQWFESVLALSGDNFTVKTGCLHAKVFCCRTKCGSFFVFEGSGNLSDNARLEQYVIDRSRRLYEFHAHWMTEYGRETTTDSIASP